MAHLRYTALMALLTLFSFFTVVYTSCTKDECKDITCNNGGSCSDGACICVSGYTGSRCEVAPDPCTGVVCHNGGICVTGACQCASGYEGVFCENKMNAKFPGVYNGTENCNANGTMTYAITITANNMDPKKIIVSNIGSMACSTFSPIDFEGTVNGNTFTINDNNCNTHLEATGTINGNTITFSYTYTVGSTTDACTATMTKL